MPVEISSIARREEVIAVMDSGLGGLSILREIAALMPGENLYYFADNLHMPYGPRPLAEVRDFVIAITGHLLTLPAKIVVIACNTASAASLAALREIFPDTPFVGMEPAVKPAVAESVSGVVGVLATLATFQGRLFESVVERFAAGAEVIRQPCPGLAEFIETHRLDDPGLIPLLERFIHPLTERGADALVLACTHYPLVKEAIQRVAGPGVRIIDPSPAIARRTRAVLAERGWLRRGEGRETALESLREAGSMEIRVSGEKENFSRSAAVFLGKEVRAESAPFLWLPQ